MDAEAALQREAAVALGLGSDDVPRVVGAGALESGYPVAELATASVASAARATAGVMRAAGLEPGEPVVDRGLAGAWFGFAVRPDGWELPSPWDPIAGDYRAADGWIRLHTNAPHHRAAALRVLGVEGERDGVARAVARWHAQELEDAVVAEDGCAAVLRDPADWAAHPQGAAVAAEPLVAREPLGSGDPGAAWRPSTGRPLAGLRVLDLTRVLAGPVATRLLAGLGADVLRIDPPGWDEPAVVPDMMLGKRSARLDARDPAGRARLADLLVTSDVVVHGYRPGALERLGLGDDERAALRPGLVDVSLDAYGWSGPWSGRRGFDSLVQMSTGIAGWGMRAGTHDVPTPLPVQALDHATGYLMAAAALSGLAALLRDGTGSRWRLSLARTASALEGVRDRERDPSGLGSSSPGSSSPGSSNPGGEPARTPIDTAWGPATLLEAPFALEVDGRAVASLRWERASHPLGGDAPAW
ncbi:MAG: CoA transferase [Schumannella sp.]